MQVRVKKKRADVGRQQRRHQPSGERPVLVADIPLVTLDDWIDA